MFQNNGFVMNEPTELGINESYYLNPHIDENSEENSSPLEFDFDSWVQYSLEISKEEHEAITRELGAEANLTIIMLVLGSKYAEALDIIRNKMIEMGI